MSFSAVFQEVFNLCIVKELSFTKEDVDALPPYERHGYISMVQHYYDEMAHQRSEAERKAKEESSRIKV